MVQAIRSFSEACRKRLGIVVHCPKCHKRVIYRATDFTGYIAPGANIEALVWRCSWCQGVSHYVRYTSIDTIEREGIAQWRPTHGMVRKWI